MTGLRARLAEVQVALMLLTRLPAGRLEPAPPLAAAAWAFPVAGGVVGGLAALVLAAATALGLPMAMAAGLALAATMLATGGLHEDGLADCADGFGGGRNRERKLDIMRDSRIGSYGALALILGLGLRWQGVQAVAEPEMALIALAASSRAGLPFALWAMPAARSDGMGQSASGAGPARAFVAAALAFALCVLVLGPEVAIKLAIVQGIVIASFSALALRQIGGQTGDVLGAMQQLAEIAGWLVLAAVATVGPGG